MRQTLIRRVSGAAAIVLLTVGVSARQLASQQPTFRSGVDLVTVDLTVVEHDGTPVSGLSASDLTVLVDGTPRRVASLLWLPPTGPAGQSALAASRSLVFVVDRSSMKAGRGMQLLHAAARYIDRLPPSARVSVAVLPRIDAVVRFDEPREVLKDRLLRATGDGMTVPLALDREDHVKALFDQLSAIDGPKQVVLIQGPEVGDVTMGSDFEALDVLMAAASAWKSRVVVHELDLWVNPGWETMAPENRASGLSTSTTSASNVEGILATSTGGLRMAPVSGDAFFKRFEREQGGSYVLAFEPLDADRDGRAHTIKVATRRLATTIRARHEFAFEASMTTSASH
jgi:VWFA-related protein